jgi:RNase P protein component
MLTLTQNIHNLRINNEVDYSLSPRDLAQFADIYRMWKHALDNGMTRIKPLDKALMNTVLCKFGDSQQREVIKRQIREIFGVTL